MVYTKKQQRRRTSKTSHKRNKTSKGGFLRLRRRGRRTTQKKNSNKNEGFIFDSSSLYTRFGENEEKGRDEYKKQATKVFEEFSEFLNSECAEFLNRYRDESSKGDIDDDHHDLPSFFERVARSIDAKARRDKRRIIGYIYGTPAKKEYNKKCKNLTRVLKNMGRFLDSTHVSSAKKIFDKEFLEKYKEIFKMIVEYSAIKKYNDNYLEKYILLLFEDVDEEEFNKIVYDKTVNNDEEITNKINPLIANREKKQKKQKEDKVVDDLIDLGNPEDTVVDQPINQQQELQQLQEENPYYKGLVGLDPYAPSSPNQNKNTRKNKNGLKGITAENNLNLIEQIKRNKTNKNSTRKNKNAPGTIASLRPPSFSTSNLPVVAF